VTSPVGIGDQPSEVSRARSARCFMAGTRRQSRVDGAAGWVMEARSDGFRLAIDTRARFWRPTVHARPRSLDRGHPWPMAGRPHTGADWGTLGLRTWVAISRTPPGKRQRGSGRDVWASQDGFWVDPLAVGCDRANPGL
jgi:hypothetical protein